MWHAEFGCEIRIAGDVDGDYAMQVNGDSPLVWMTRETLLQMANDIREALKGDSEMERYKTWVKENRP
jgi:hypothetical protein